MPSPAKSSNDQTTHKGQCFCGAVQIEVTGTPLRMGYCHCADCRSWAAAPVNGFSLWRPSDVVVTQGEADIATFKKTEKSHRQFCRKCGGHLMSVHPTGGYIDVYASVLPTLEFEPSFHVFHSESVLRTDDDLPRYVDLPEAAGGSGEMVE
jgi:hypothetical protein